MKVDKTQKNKAKFTFTIKPNEFEKAITKAYENIKKDIEIPGFRKGQVPQKIYETRRGVSNLYHDALNIVLNEKYLEAAQSKKADIYLAAEPEIIFDINEVKRDNQFDISLVFWLLPQVKLGKYKGIEIEVKEPKVSTKEVDNDIRATLGLHDYLEPKKGGIIEKGDTAIFDFEGFKDGKPFEGGKAENYELIIGSNSFIPGFEDKMIGMKEGEEKTIDVTFPKEYHAKDLAGKKVKFKLKVHEVKVKTTPKLNETTFKENLGKLDKKVKTLAEFRKITKNHILEHKRKHEIQHQKQDILNKVRKNSKIDVCDAIIDSEVEQSYRRYEQQMTQSGMSMDQIFKMTGQTEAEFRKKLRPDALRNIEEIFVLDEIKKEEKIKVTKKDLDTKLQEIADTYKKSLNEVKKLIDIRQLEFSLSITKTLDFLYDNAKIIKK